jgi:hypothetical protein
MNTPENQNSSPANEVTSPAATPAEPTAAAPVSPKPKLSLNVAPRSTAANLNTAASAQKAPDRKYVGATAQDDNQPSAIITIIAGLAAAAAITFAVLLFLKTK